MIVTHFFLYLSVEAKTNKWSLMDCAYRWCNITCDIGSGSIVESVEEDDLADSKSFLFRIFWDKCGGRNGGLLMDDGKDPNSSKLGIKVVQSSEA